METGVAHFTCDACGKRYRWKPALAGRAVKCGCGHVMSCPAEAPRDDALYDLAAPDAPGRSAAPPPPAQPPPAPPAAVPLAYQSGRVAADEALDKLFPDRPIDLYLPLGLIAGATVIELVAAAIRSSGPAAGLQGELLALAVRLIIAPITMLIGVFITAKVRGIELGRLPVALLKLAAIAVGPAAIITLISPALAVIPLAGGLIGLIGHFVLYFALLGTLFKMDESDTWYCVCVIFLIDLCVYFSLRAWQASAA